MTALFIQAFPYCSAQKLFAHFAKEEGAVLLDSALSMTELGRYSFIALDPFLSMIAKDTKIKLDSDYLGLQETISGNPFTVLQTYLNLYKITKHPDLPPFQGGAVGYLGYDLCHHLERLQQYPPDDLQFPDLALGFYDVVLAFDHHQQQAMIISSGLPETEPVLQAARAQKRAYDLLEKMKVKEKISNHINLVKLSLNKITSNFTQTNYEQAVEQVRDYIEAGDIYEANISQRFTTILPAHAEPYQLYQQLRRINPAPFAAYMHFADTVIASASPERFLKLAEGVVESRPIKGTCKRSSDLAEDASLAQALLCSEKDRCENIMIVDLLRNDLSKVCLSHSVRVPQLCGLETYATVHHLVSVVTGQVQPGYGSLDVLMAAFPGGSITGTPKIRAMEIIAELESHARGPYCGCLVYFGFDGSMDSAITIRTFCLQGNQLTFQVGGAIVADSDPKAEYEETLNKAAALQAAYVAWGNN